MRLVTTQLKMELDFESWEFVLKNISYKQMHDIIRANTVLDMSKDQVDYWRRTIRRFQSLLMHSEICLEGVKKLPDGTFEPPRSSYGCNKGCRKLNAILSHASTCRNKISEKKFTDCKNEFCLFIQIIFTHTETCNKKSCLYCSTPFAE